MSSFEIWCLPIFANHWKIFDKILDKVRMDLIWWILSGSPIYPYPKVYSRQSYALKVFKVIWFFVWTLLWYSLYHIGDIIWYESYHCFQVFKSFQASKMQNKYCFIMSHNETVFILHIIYVNGFEISWYQTWLSRAA